MRNRMYGGVRGRKMKVGGKLLHFPPTRLPDYQHLYLLELLQVVINNTFLYSKNKHPSMNLHKNRAFNYILMRIFWLFQEKT